MSYPATNTAVVDTHIVWFRRDLRLDDNSALLAASAADRLLCVYCVDARFFADSAYGAVKIDRHRRAFIAQALVDLSQAIEYRGGCLIVRFGEPEDVLPALAERYAASIMWLAEDAAPEEQDQLARVQQAMDGRTGVRTTPANTLYTVEALPFDVADVPSVYTRFRKAVEQGCPIAQPSDAPERLPGINVSTPPATELERVREWINADARFTGGEQAGNQRLAHYLWRSQAIAHYKQTRNDLLGLDFSSKLSPWLANGCLSVRRVAAEVARFASQVTANKSTYWLLFELRWREFYHWTLAARGAQLFARSGLLDRDDRPTARHEAVMEAWKRGRTGMPFIDANMRELARTGYMSNRGRQNAASFLARDLGQDWRWGAAWFEAQLIDYDVASNWGNWATVAGVGTDKRDQGFNIMAQALRYDTDQRYILHWLPELQALPASKRHASYLCNDAELAAAGYPRLIIDVPSFWDATQG